MRIGICACGCDEEIVLKSHHKWYGMPKFLRGHKARVTPIPRVAKNWGELKRPYEIGKTYACLCGCGNNIQIKPWHKRQGVADYVKGHDKYGHTAWNRGLTKESSEQVRAYAEKQSKTRLGQTKENCARVRKSAQTKTGQTKENHAGVRKISETLKRRGIHPPRWNKGLTKENHPSIKRASDILRQKGVHPPQWNKGLTKETDSRILLIGEKVSAALKGRTKETHEGIKRMSEKISGPRSPCWKGGISGNSYASDLTKTIRCVVRARDDFTCQLCDKLFNPGKGTTLLVHHIDYDKKNSELSNLITLCRSCHSKTNYQREAWIRYFVQGRFTCA